jgi:hypothetical protein
MQTYASFIPTQEWLENLKVGDFAPDCFGTMSRVTDIRYSGRDLAGRSYVGVYLHLSENARISHSYKVGEPVVTVPGGTSGRWRETAERSAQDRFTFVA